MPRPRAFDETQVLDRATALFWRQGYAATSIQDLVEATGLNRASIYATFGDKQRLFHAALEHYLARINAARLGLLAPGGAAAIGAFLRSLIGEAEAERRLGCLVTNSLTECAPHDAHLTALLADSLARVEAALAEAIQRGQNAGAIARTHDALALAGLILGLAQGIRVLARGGAPAASLHAIVTTALGLLGQPNAA